MLGVVRLSWGVFSCCVSSSQQVSKLGKEVKLEGGTGAWEAQTLVVAKRYIVEHVDVGHHPPHISFG